MVHWIIFGVVVWLAGCGFMMSWMAGGTAEDDQQLNLGRVWLALGVIFSIAAYFLY